MEKDNSTAGLLFLCWRKDIIAPFILKLFQGFLSAIQKFKHFSVSNVYYFRATLVDWLEAASFLSLANKISVKRKYQGGES